ncbi:site-2 protease family protein [Hymenobacter terrenus]|uniref:site-2 protease family protein n=1 Tax=Hymenobacter terrenus TaxID=1629124 RepID=UPI0006191D5A|nr:site-2 protease family protein [Hymenobacter terrenus]
MKKNIRSILLILVLFGTGGVVGGLSGKYAVTVTANSHWGPWRVGGALLVLLPLAWLVAVGLHELGHALAGRMQGFAFHWLAVGPLLWKKRDGRLRFEWNTNLNTAGGMVLSVPTGDHNLRRRFLAFAAGGPLGSLAWAVLALAAWALLPVGTSEIGKLLRLGLGISGGISALLTMLTLIPMHTGGFYSDGARVLNLWRDGPAGQLEVAVISALARSVAGVRPRKLPLSQLEAAAALSDELPFKLYVYHYLYLAALDAGQFEPAGYYLREYRDRLGPVPTVLQASVWLESAFFAAAYEYDLPAARAFLTQAKITTHIPADVPPRVQAAIARLAGDVDGACAQAQAALCELSKSFDQGSAHFYAEWLADTVRWARQTDPAANTNC